MQSNSSAIAREKTVDFLVKYGVYIVFVILCVIFARGNPNFLTASNLVLLLQQSAPMILGVIGMTFVMMDGAIDVSAGSNMYLSAAVCGVLLTEFNKAGVNNNSLSIYILVFLVAIVVGCSIGVVNGIMVARFKMVPFIATVIMTSIARGIGLYITNAKMITLNTLGFKLSDKVYGGISIQIYIALVLILIFHFVLHGTKYGLHLKAQGNNKQAAQKMGINTTRNTLTAYIICGGLCGLAGIMSAGSTGSIPSYFANGNEFVIIPAAVLGGTSLFGGKGNIIPGAIIGMILVNTIVNGLTMMDANPYVYTIIRGAIIFLAVMLDSINYKGELR